MIKIAICDDEYPCVEKIKALTTHFFMEKEIAIDLQTFTSGEQLLQSDFLDIDIVFLDVNLLSSNGIDVGKEIRRRNKKVILIFVSALVQFAIQGYSVHAFQFLLKQDLAQTFDQCMEDVLRQLPSMGSFFIPTESGGIKVPLHDIIYFEVRNHQITVHTQNQLHDCWQYNDKITNVEGALKNVGFLRIHRSFLVNMRHIALLEKGLAYLTNKETLPCSRKNFSEVLQKYMIWEAME